MITPDQQKAEPNPSKVVLESSASDALIRMALDEKLLFWDQRNDDGLGERFYRRQIPKWVTKQALEQIVLFEQVHLSTHTTNRYLSGPLLEDGKLVFMDDHTPSNATIGSVSLEVLNGLLLAHRVTPNPLEDNSILTEAQHAISEVAAWEQKYGESSNDWDILPKKIALIVAHTAARRPGIPEDEPRYKELAHIKKGYERFLPAATAVESFLRAASIAEDRAAYLMSPMDESIGASTIDLPIPEGASYQTKLLRLASEELGVIPYRPTLEQTLKIARDPATLDIQAKIIEWSENLMRGEVDAIQRTQSEIRKAAKALDSANWGSRVSSAITYLGVPVTFAGLTEFSAFLSAVGIAMTVAGAVSQGAHDGTKRAYRWATFGTYVTRAAGKSTRD